MQSYAIMQVPIPSGLSEECGRCGGPVPLQNGMMWFSGGRWVLSRCCQRSTSTGFRATNQIVSSSTIDVAKLPAKGLDIPILPVAPLFIEWGSPRAARCIYGLDNGPEFIATALCAWYRVLASSADAR